jgi:hypothetical protein
MTGEEMEDTIKEEYKDAPAVKDEIGTIVEEQLIENLKNDIAAYEKALESLQKEKANYEEQLEIDFKIQDIMLKPGNLRKVAPEREFEKDPEFWDLAEKKQAFAVRQDRAIARGQLDSFEKQLSDLQRKRDSAIEKYNKFSGGQ